MKKISLLPAPKSPMFRGSFESCNNDKDFKKDPKVIKNFHKENLKSKGCTIPYFGGTLLNYGKEHFCTNKSDYNPATSEFFLHKFLKYVCPTSKRGSGVSPPECASTSL